MFLKSVVFKLGNNGPGILGGAKGGPSDPSSQRSPRVGQTPPWQDVCTMDRDLSENDSKYSRRRRGRGRVPGAPTSVASPDGNLPSGLCAVLGSGSVLLRASFLPSFLSCGKPICRLLAIVPLCASGQWRRMVTSKTRTFHPVHGNTVPVLYLSIFFSLADRSPPLSCPSRM